MVEKIIRIDEQKVALRDVNFVQKNLKLIAAFAWKSFLEAGKGVVIIDFRLTKVNLPLNLTKMIFVSPQFFESDGFTPPQKEKILDIITRYDPNIGAAVLCMDSHNINIYKISCYPLPPEAYEELGPF